MAFVRLSALLAVIFVSAAIAAAQPVIGVSQDTVDFGTVTPRQWVAGTVEVYNRGSDTLVISNIETSCGCTAATPDASRIAFMETATIRVSINIEHKTGHIVQWVRIKTNDPHRSDKDVYFKVNVLDTADTAKPKE